MLPKQYRLRDREHYNLVVRKGKRAGNKYLVIHHLTGQFGASVPLVGFVVSKKQVPRAVHRNQVKRRLRALIWRNRHLLASDLALVIRVNAAAGEASSEVLEQKLFSLLRRNGLLAEAPAKPLPICTVDTNEPGATTGLPKTTMSPVPESKVEEK